MDETAAEGSDNLRVGALAVRVWIEADRPGVLRAQITSAFDVASAETVVVNVVDEDAILAAVRGWLQAFKGG